jgi:hypothetical protein
LPGGKDDSLREWDGKGKTGVGGQTSEVTPVKCARPTRLSESDGGQATLSPREFHGAGRTFGNLRFHSTFDIIEAAEKGLLPDKIMINTHPQRWTDKPWPWVRELVWQNVKNVIKKVFLCKKVKMED